MLKLLITTFTLKIIFFNFLVYPNWSSNFKIKYLLNDFYYPYSYFSSFFLIENCYFFYYLLSCFIISFLLIFLSFFFSGTFLTSNKYLKSKSFECGFDSIGLNQNFKFNVDYFKISLIFLIFDLELLYLFPWLSVAKYFIVLKFYGFFYFSYFIFLILIVGVFYEYLSDVITWNKT